MRVIRSVEDILQSLHDDGQIDRQTVYEFVNAGSSNLDTRAPWLAATSEATELEKDVFAFEEVHEPAGLKAEPLANNAAIRDDDVVQTYYTIAAGFLVGMRHSRRPEPVRLAHYSVSGQVCTRNYRVASLCLLVTMPSLDALSFSHNWHAKLDSLPRPNYTNF